MKYVRPSGSRRGCKRAGTQRSRDPGSARTGVTHVSKFGDHWVLEPNQDRPGQSTDLQTFYIVATKIPRRDDGTHHLRTDTSHLVQLVTRIVLQPVLLRRRQTIPSRFMPPLLGSAATDHPLDARQRCPIVVRTSFAKPHEDVTVKSTALLCLPMARNMKSID